MSTPITYVMGEKSFYGKFFELLGITCGQDISWRVPYAEKRLVLKKLAERLKALSVDEAFELWQSVQCMRGLDTVISEMARLERSRNFSTIQGIIHDLPAFLMDEKAHLTPEEAADYVAHQPVLGALDGVLFRHQSVMV